jgi:hypothetical protein
MTPKEINDLYNNCEHLYEIQGVLLENWPKIYELIKAAEGVAYGLEISLCGGSDDRVMYSMAVSLANYKKALKKLEIEQA